MGTNCNGAGLWGTELGGVGLGYGNELQWGWDVGMNRSGAGMWGTELGGVGLGCGNELQWG